MPNDVRGYIEMTDVSKEFGHKRVLDTINLSICKGQVVGFIGPNGSGKTTMLKLLAGIYRPSTGDVRVDGQRTTGRPINCGLMLENPPFVDSLSGIDNLRYIDRISAHRSLIDVAEHMLYVGLDPQNRLPVRKYSLGMRQRLALAQAIMGSPSLLLLDEPANGLDPAAIVDFRTMITEQAEKGTTVIMLTHQLPEAEKICDKFFIIFATHVTELSDEMLQQRSLEEAYLTYTNQSVDGIKNAVG